MTLSLTSCWLFGHKCGHKAIAANRQWLYSVFIKSLLSQDSKRAPEGRALVTSTQMSGVETMVWLGRTSRPQEAGVMVPPASQSPSCEPSVKAACLELVC